MAFINEWFKVIKDGSLIGTATDLDFARYSEKSGRVHICKAIEGQYVTVDGRYFRDDWMLVPPKDSYMEWEHAEVISISEEEYDILNRGGAFDVKVEDVKIPGEDIPKKVSEPVTIDFVRKRKLAELSEECRKVIENGFDLVLSDGVSHHFSMTIQDQMNMQDLKAAYVAGEDLMYHADGELTQFYSREDIFDILTMAKQWKNYNLTYYNAMKSWINQIEDISEIEEITFETIIPEAYCTPAMLTILNSYF